MESNPNVKNIFPELEMQIEEVWGKERIETKQMELYKGTVKKW